MTPEQHQGTTARLQYFHMTFLLAYLVFTAVGCSTAPPLGEAISDEGTWQVSTDREGYPVGWADLTLLVARVDMAAASPDLTLSADILMPAMGHGSSEESTVIPSEDVANSWLLRSFFTMGGAWLVQGLISDGVTSEGFSLDVEVGVEM